MECPLSAPLINDVSVALKAQARLINELHLTMHKLREELTKLETNLDNLNKSFD
jgi:hypothetical protein